MYYTLFEFNVFTSKFIGSRQWAVKIWTNRNFVDLMATNRIGYLLIKWNLLVLVVWGININETQFVFIDGSAYNNKSAFLSAVTFVTSILSEGLKRIITPLLCFEPCANKMSPPHSARQKFSKLASLYVSCKKNYIKFPNMQPPGKFSSFDRFVEASCIKRNSIYGHIHTRLISFFLTQFMKRSIAFSLAMKIFVPMVRWLQFTIGCLRRIQITWVQKVYGN